MNPNEGAPNGTVACEKYREQFGDRNYYELMISLQDDTPEYCPSEFWDIPNPEEDENGECRISCGECWCRVIPEKKDAVSLDDIKKAGDAAKKAAEEISKSTDALSCLAGIRENAEKAGGKKIMSSWTPETLEILDSGDRTEFETGAVRDMREGKGRCDLMLLEVVSRILATACPGRVMNVPIMIGDFQRTGDTSHLYKAIDMFTHINSDTEIGSATCTMLLEVSKHFEEGAKKYGENNWQKGIPVHCYIDSAVRHYLKWLRGDTDEPHDRAFVWNLMCCIWEVDYRKKDGKSDAV